ncbi:hypothetical protein BaRGS_00002507 [Batillaria attramentaria]|uniref:Uncharacterized protein n=1 Tax=Batillaria attramentaria TaxID=370345 RepID=A0ABD0M419_9CAEN
MLGVLGNCFGALRMTAMTYIMSKKQVDKVVTDFGRPGTAVNYPVLMQDDIGDALGMKTTSVVAQFLAIHSVRKALT